MTGGMILTPTLLRQGCEMPEVLIWPLVGHKIELKLSKSIMLFVKDWPQLEVQSCVMPSSQLCSSKFDTKLVGTTLRPEVYIRSRRSQLLNADFDHVVQGQMKI